MIFSNLSLKITLPIRNNFMKRLCCWRKIIRTIYALFVEINMNMRQPFIVHFNTLLRFYLSSPSPISIQIKQIMIWSTSRPRLMMFFCILIGVVWCTFYLVVPVYISISPIRINTRIHNYNRIF